VPCKHFSQIFLGPITALAAIAFFRKHLDLYEKRKYHVIVEWTKAWLTISLHNVQVALETGDSLEKFDSTIFCVIFIKEHLPVSINNI
jgi:ABC-type Co2+ transport system permease subunit